MRSKSNMQLKPENNVELPYFSCKNQHLFLTRYTYQHTAGSKSKAPNPKGLNGSLKGKEAQFVYRARTFCVVQAGHRSFIPSVAVNSPP